MVKQQLGPGLEVHRLSPHLYLHLSNIQLSNGAVFSCNGLIYINKGEAVVFDTPVKDEESQQLIDWLRHDQKLMVKGIVVNHFHEDCLGGLAPFHEAGIKSYSHKQTQLLAQADTLPVPQIGFENALTLTIGGAKVDCWYPGEAHTTDNIIAWIPSEKTLFGGCMLKAVGAGKGNLADANINTWSQTIQKVKAKYPEIKIAVPGHGQTGGMELLDFTIELFQPNK
ncbi:MAG: subclass B1 metallo-beta-lactamase [Saprospiraceae bacterium]